MKPLLVTSGEPAGIGPDLCLMLASQALPIVVLGDKTLLAARAKKLNLSVTLVDYKTDQTLRYTPHELNILSIPCPITSVPGVLNPHNAPYVIQMLTIAAERCMQGEFAGLVTAPVNKAVINQSGLAFSGHTEFFSEYCGSEGVVMMLACDVMRVALVTTHLPLRAVADALTDNVLKQTIKILNQALKHDFGIEQPNIYVAGLNPHAGEMGYLGREEIDIIQPVLAQMQHDGINVQGPFPADTMFTQKYIDTCDAFLAMYHDQGLPVLKYAGFGRAVNVTLGLPIIRTSVDHGTACDLAGTGKAETASLRSAIEMAMTMAKQREHHDTHY